MPAKTLKNKEYSLPSSSMEPTDSIAFFNSNADTSYLCFGKGTSISFEQSIDFNALQAFITAHKGKFIYGYLSYDVKNSIEQLTSSNTDHLHFPVLYFHVPETVVKTEQGNQVIIQGVETPETMHFIASFFRRLKTGTCDSGTGSFHARISKEEYLKAVNKLKEHIQRGDIYEINFCQEYFSEQVELTDPVSVYATINTVTQAPFSVYLQHDQFHAFCGSPERFLQKKGATVRSQPIKGTARRGATENEDEYLKTELVNNPKERSENVMIVDLVRNDLSKIAEKGTVTVDELFGVYTYQTVHQLVSTISCQVSEAVSFTDLIKATFPMGSMTGAPKVSAMKLSEQYESFKRGLYSGSIGYILPNGDFDFNVVIRSLLYNSQTNYLSCGVGGAITINSDPEKEYEECETKVRKLLNAVTG